MNPYKNLPDANFWRRTVSNVSRADFDPVTETRFKIAASDKVATAGSCFAQNIARHLKKIGFDYYVAESGAELSEGEQERRQFGIFSARYGNVYTSRQLLQLFSEAFSDLRSGLVWRRPDGRYVDPFRPTVEPDGFEEHGLLIEERRKHLKHVREMFCNLDVFVFTLGLTEAWMHLPNSDMLPLAPGVAGGEFSDDYGFVNLSVQDIVEDLSRFIEGLKGVNPAARVLLTVSPVPLAATYENKNVLTATTLSKAVLRVAAEEIYKQYQNVDYFPSYEIITGSFNFGSYYEEDARQVNDLGVTHVMRSFTKNYTDKQDAQHQGSDPAAMADRDAFIVRKVSKIVCDEELLLTVR